MTNGQSAEALWSEAQRIRSRDLAGALQDRDWNMCVRRSQEVVELALKASLRLLGTDYPKKHDVAPLFADLAVRKELGIPPEALERLKQASAWLAEMRGLAFYMEKAFSQQEAALAAQSADFVLQTLRAVIRTKK
ncbi:MAG: HEPN domain-containing protein [Elusimicrobia bacterium]|nr:HEPN domain-containing protein [Elusimicrobiota bacterium]